MALTKQPGGKRRLLYEASPDLASEDWEPALPCLPCCEQEARSAYQIGQFRVVACPECGTARVDPRLREPVRLERIYNQSDYFTPEPSHPSPLNQFRKAVYRSVVSLYQHPDAQHRRVDFLTRFAPSDQPIRYLEIGCGPGRLLRVLQKRCPRWEFTGIEPSDFAAEECRRAGWRVLTGTVEQVDLAGERFDAICAWNVIEHVDSPPTFMTWIAAHLQPGGHVFLHTPQLRRPDAAVLGRLLVRVQAGVPPLLLHLPGPDPAGRVRRSAALSPGRDPPPP